MDFNEHVCFEGYLHCLYNIRLSDPYLPLILQKVSDQGVMRLPGLCSSTLMNQHCTLKQERFLFFPGP